MNAVGTNAQQLMELPLGLQQNHGTTLPLSEQKVFQNLLVTAGEIMKDGSKSGALTDTRNLADKLLSNRTNEEMAGNEISEAEAVHMMVELLLQTIVGSNLNPSEASQGMAKREGSIIVSHPSLQLTNGQMLEKQFSRIIRQAEEILGQLNGQKSISKAAPELLKLLEQWSTLIKKADQHAIIQPELPEMKSGKEQTIWKDLVQSFQKRNQLAVREQYRTNAKVTTQDVVKWLQRAVQNQSNFDTPAGKSLPVSSVMPVSKVEQYVIHLNQTNSQPISHQLVEKFQNVMKTSRFISLQNGTSQLNIALRPENLGDVIVKMTQINGEMTVKIIVSSAAAKDMLESNMHQLKNMFSPQQVSIEKQETSSHQSQASQHEDERQQTDDHHEGQSEQSGQHNGENAEEDDFDAQLREVLTNEKV
ncbi:flagellar hook-length control protein FliK [Lentibacillus persicus]|uniref:flagellar hook-length control protein FliK n=1 Tax=Lentibacillus persicus TaxID=640948 RepID=UPI0015A6FD3B|nr:flagellar hook-length control protein FliK [Lentibacillus persicus]